MNQCRKKLKPLSLEIDECLLQGATQEGDWHNKSGTILCKYEIGELLEQVLTATGFE